MNKACAQTSWYALSHLRIGITSRYAEDHVRNDIALKHHA